MRPPRFNGVGRPEEDKVSAQVRVASAKVVCDGPGEQRAFHIEAATA